MSGSTRRIDLASELVAGFVAGLLAAFFLLTFVSVFFTQVFSSGLLGRVVGVLGYLNPTGATFGRLLVLVGGGLGAYWRYVFATRRSETGDRETRP